MKAPETIYSDGIPNLAGCIFAGRHKTDQSNLEYRLVGECNCKGRLIISTFGLSANYCLLCGNKIKVIE